MNPARKRRLALLVTVATATTAAVAGSVWWWHATRLPKRFAAVVPGRLYRSGEITPAHLERLRNEHGIRTVLSLCDPGAPESIAERAAAERLNLNWLNVRLMGNGESTPADRDRIRAILADESHAPLLVHCAAGANRTGLAIGMYRLHHDHWPLDRVMAELREFDFEDEPHHENLRQALAAEAASAAAPNVTARSTPP